MNFLTEEESNDLDNEQVEVIDILQTERFDDGSSNNNISSNNPEGMRLSFARDLREPLQPPPNVTEASKIIIPP